MHQTYAYTYTHASGRDSPSFLSSCESVWIGWLWEKRKGMRDRKEQNSHSYQRRSENWSECVIPVPHSFHPFDLRSKLLWNHKKVPFMSRNSAKEREDESEEAVVVVINWAPAATTGLSACGWIIKKRGERESLTNGLTDKWWSAGEKSKSFFPTAVSRKLFYNSLSSRFLFCLFSSLLFVRRQKESTKDRQTGQMLCLCMIVSSGSRKKRKESEAWRNTRKRLLPLLSLAFFVNKKLTCRPSQGLQCNVTLSWNKKEDHVLNDRRERSSVCLVCWFSCPLDDENDDDGDALPVCCLRDSLGCQITLLVRREKQLSWFLSSSQSMMWFWCLFVCMPACSHAE